MNDCSFSTAIPRSSRTPRRMNTSSARWQRSSRVCRLVSNVRVCRSALPRANSASLRPGHFSRVGESTTERRCCGEPMLRQSLLKSMEKLFRRAPDIGEPGESVGEPQRAGEDVPAVDVDVLRRKDVGWVLECRGEEVRGAEWECVMRWESVGFQLTATPSKSGSHCKCSWSAGRTCMLRQNLSIRHCRGSLVHFGSTRSSSDSSSDISPSTSRLNDDLLRRITGTPSSGEFMFLACSLSMRPAPPL
mmetsp:Transcript_21391/g.51510  ORF Transcript_21391/g.51510 Transcript_21391/m.51510 type:complete len:247 (+) Transcript_21391:544-1284(+)